MISELTAIAAAACSIFPHSFSTNRKVTGLPVLPGSDRMIAALSPDTGIHPDFGSVYGIPFDKVGRKTPRTRVSFDYADESDHVRYPIPGDVHIEAGGGDRHALLVDRRRCRLYELYALEKRTRPPGGWHAGSGATWNLRSKKLRPKGWTSADAAGLPIFPLLARPGGPIRHALRVTFSRTRDAYVYPARHAASSDSDPALPRMGERLRLKRSFDLSRLHGQARTVARAMKTYGLIVADNGSNWYVTGTPSHTWDDDVLHTLGEIKGSDFEVVDASSLR